MMCGQDLQNTDNAQIRTHVVNRCFLVILKAQGAWEYAGTVGNDHSFAHAKHGGTPQEKTHIS